MKEGSKGKYASDESVKTAVWKLLKEQLAKCYEAGIHVPVSVIIPVLKKKVLLFDSSSYIYIYIYIYILIVFLLGAC